MPKLKALLVPVVIAAAGAMMEHASIDARVASRSSLPAIAANDNRVAAGVSKNGVLELRLDTRQGEWRPYGAGGPAISIFAFGEVGKPLQTPGPMIRVQAGTRIHVSVTNSASTTLVVHGLADRNRVMMDTLVVPAGATRDVGFVVTNPGTFFYWGTTTASAFGDRVYQDAQLSGALIVDPAGRLLGPTASSWSSGSLLASCPTARWISSTASSPSTADRGRTPSG